MFQVNLMKQEEFKNWDQLLKKTSKRRCAINFSKFCYFRFNSNFKNGYGCGDTYEKYLSRNDLQVSMVYGRAKSASLNFDLSTFSAPRQYFSPILLSGPKVADLTVLVSEWVPPAIKRQYWDKLLSAQTSGTVNITETNQPQPRTSDSDHLEDAAGNDTADDNNDIINVDQEPEMDEILLLDNFYEYD